MGEFILRLTKGKNNETPECEPIGPASIFIWIFDAWDSLEG